MGISTNMAATVGLVLKKGVSSLINSSPKGLFQQQIPSVFFANSKRNGATWSPDAEFYKQYENQVMVSPEFSRAWKLPAYSNHEPAMEKNHQHQLEFWTTASCSSRRVASCART